MRTKEEVLKEFDAQMLIHNKMGIVEKYRHPKTEERIRTLAWILKMVDNLPRYPDEND